MKKLIGSEVDVFIRGGETISGMLFDSDSDSIYIQNEIGVVTAIPIRNVKYCVALSQAPLQSKSHDDDTETSIPQPVSKQIDYHEQSEDNSALKVLIDGELVARVPVPPHLSVASCSRELISLAYSDLVVQSKLRNVVQSSIEYDVGEINIITSGSNVSLPNFVAKNVEFSMEDPTPGVKGPEAPLDLLRKISLSVNGEK